MKRVLIYLFTITLLSFIFVSFSKGESSSLIKSKKILLTQEIWKSEKVVMGENDVTQSVGNFSVKFFLDGTCKEYTNGILDEQGTWEFNSDRTKIISDKGTEEEETVTILELTESTFKVEAETEIEGVKMKFITTFKH